MNLEGIQTVYRADTPVGQCDFVSQGLYWKMCCTIREGWEGVSRLVLFSEKEPVSLGIPIPQGAVLMLERQIPRKSLPEEGGFYLELLPADAPLLSRRGKTEEAPPELPMEEPLPEAVPEELPGEEPLSEESPATELPPEAASEEIPMEEPFPEAAPEQAPLGNPLPEGISLRPGDKLPPLENWQDFRVKPDGRGGLLLFCRSQG